MIVEYLAPSSSGLGRCPLKAEIAGSNPAGATNSVDDTAAWKHCSSVVPGSVVLAWDGGYCGVSLIG